MGRGEEGVLGSLASHPDYSESTMAKCLSVLQKSSMAETDIDVVRFSDLLEKVRAHFWGAILGCVEMLLNALERGVSVMVDLRCPDFMGGVFVLQLDYVWAPLCCRDC